MSSDFRSIYLPDFCSVRMVFSVVLISELLAILLELASPPSRHGFMSGVGLRSLAILWVALVSAGCVCVLRKKLQRCNEIAAGCAAFALIQGVTVLETWMVSGFLPAHGVDLMPGPPRDKLSLYLRNLGISVIVSAALLRYFYVQSQWKKQIKAETEARLEALQSRMRPHFLFNSLNTVASLTQLDPELAEQLVQDLAELLRASLAGSNARLIPLAREIELAKHYLNIERHRLGDRLRVAWRLEEVPKDALVPLLSIQPLIENAVYHGIEPRPDGGEIDVTGSLKAGTIILTVKNPIPTVNTGEPRQGNRIAMENLNHRIRGFFDGEGQVMVSVVDAFYQVRLVFPYLKDSQ